MDSTQWIAEAFRHFAVEKPEHFTNYTHCCECEEHDETLRNSDVHRIGMDQLGNGGWDPLCFCSTEGLLYYAPALIRLSFETLDDDFYFLQLLFHLEYDGQKNRFLNACSTGQRVFIADFVNFIILNYPERFETHLEQDSALSVAELWSEPGIQNPDSR